MAEEGFCRLTRSRAASANRDGGNIIAEAFGLDVEGMTANQELNAIYQATDFLVSRSE
ncbi:MAG: hypothetical protein GY696_14180 [Gammaproteobacteria bacterium]|nr:hypothetical protein [Gammaproteobacteria bacterium]